ncbi:TPA: hypothetical protein ACJMKJ_003057 [Bacillus wiedmannii]
MQLTKLEKAIALGTILNAIDEDKLEDYVELESLRPVVKVLNKRTKPEEKKEAGESVVSKFIHKILEDEEQ